MEDPRKVQSKFFTLQNIKNLKAIMFVPIIELTFENPSDQGVMQNRSEMRIFLTQGLLYLQ